MKITQRNLLTEFPKLTKQQALEITRLVNGTLDPEEFKAAQERIRECYNRPTDTDLILTIVNEMIGGYGVEGVPWEENALYNDEFISYVNMGDTYATTLVFNPDSNRIEIGCWGNIYEKSPAYNAELNQDEEAV